MQQPKQYLLFLVLDFIGFQSMLIRMLWQLSKRNSTSFLYNERVCLKCWHWTYLHQQIVWWCVCKLTDFLYSFDLFTEWIFPSLFPKLQKASFPTFCLGVFVYPKNKLTNLHPLHENLENGAKNRNPSNVLPKWWHWVGLTWKCSLWRHSGNGSVMSPYLK